MASSTRCLRCWPSQVSVTTLRWPRLGQYVWPNVFIGQTYEEEVAFLRNWILERVAWLDDNIEGTCIPGCTDVTACNYEPTALFDDGSREPCECPGDLDNDLAVGVSDILAALSEFGLHCRLHCRHGRRRPSDGLRLPRNPERLWRDVLSRVTVRREGIEWRRLPGQTSAPCRRIS